MSNDTNADVFEALSKIWRRRVSGDDVSEVQGVLTYDLSCVLDASDTSKV